MKKLEVPFLATVNRNCAVADISNLLDKLPKNRIEELPWSHYDYRPEVSFAIGHSNDCIYIKYYVREHTVKALTLHTNGPVYKDSCVEFFLAFAGEQTYYNFEFNCIGTCLVGYGSSRNERELVPASVIEKIRYQAVLTKDGSQDDLAVSWELVLVIPLEVFHFHRLPSLSGLRCQVNFFKCGDDLPRPHFLSWNKIQTEEPDFHQLQFFGEAVFAQS